MTAALGSRPPIAAERNPPHMSTLSASFELLPHPTSVPTARHLTVQVLRAWEVPHDLDDAALLVTELVSNVVDHVGGGATLVVEVDCSQDWLRIGVVDGSVVLPVVRALDHARPRGRGLRMLRSIASRWGTERVGDGKRVWFELEPALR